MENSKTERGFRLITFRDRYNQPCSLQESSLATQGCVWFGVDARLNLNTGELLEDSDNHRMHLTQGQVAELLPYLKHFVEHGDLPEKVDAQPRTEYVLQTAEERFLYDGHAAVDFVDQALRFETRVEDDVGSAWEGASALQRGKLRIVPVRVIPAQVELVR
jgi:hypothetical protein